MSGVRYVCGSPPAPQVTGGRDAAGLDTVRPRPQNAAQFTLSGGVKGRAGKRGSRPCFTEAEVEILCRLFECFSSMKDF